MEDGMTGDRSGPPEIQLKRVYDPPAASDGLRVLVDRIWPRGLSKEKAAVDVWARDVAPSTELRKWFHHDPVRWEEFQSRYRSELKVRTEALANLRARCASGPASLLFAAKDTKRNHAVVLREILACDKAGRGN
jgi:uncharacterized protein YeaO (DUF488 family)